MIFAPVLIPTLNRVKHLQRCLNSLVKNTYANETEIYISIDYPPSEKYMQGWKDVNNLIKSMDLSVFKEVHIFCQEQNLGSVNNFRFLQNVIRDKHDRYITTEDDNEFSPNFLSYMNKGLELYKENPKVLGICAARHADWINNGNICYSKFCPCYGFGTWDKKYNKIENEITEYFLDRNYYTFKALWPVFIHSGFLFKYYVKYIVCRLPSIFFYDNGKLRVCDTVLTMYMHCFDYFVIQPAVAKSRTWGNDGSGENMPKLDIDVESIEIDQNSNFEFDQTSQIYFNKKNYKIGDKSMSKISPIWDRLIGLGFYMLYLICGKNEYKVNRIFKKC